MIFLYVNLVSWKFASELPDSVRVVFRCDSISYLIVARLIGFPLKRSSGVHEYHFRDQNQEALILSATMLNEDNEVVLPYWKDLDDIQLYDGLIERLKEAEVVYIGISSPKQDKLATIIQDNFPSIDIYCFGAAIYSPSYFQTLDKMGLSWLGFFVKNPERFFTKTLSTVKELVLLTCSRSYRKKFRAFCARFEQA